jgi:hypothetical protein
MIAQTLSSMCTCKESCNDIMTPSHLHEYLQSHFCCTVLEVPSIIIVPHRPSLEQALGEPPVGLRAGASVRGSIRRGSVQRGANVPTCQHILLYTVAHYVVYVSTRTIHFFFIYTPIPYTVPDQEDCIRAPTRTAYVHTRPPTWRSLVAFWNVIGL